MPESTRSASLNRTRRASLLASGPFASDSAAAGRVTPRFCSVPASRVRRAVCRPMERPGTAGLWTSTARRALSPVSPATPTAAGRTSSAPNSKRIRLTAPPADSSARRVGLAVAAAFLHHRRRPHRRTRHHRRAERRRATTAVVSALRVRVSEVDLAWRVHVPATRVSTVFQRTTARAGLGLLHPALLLELVVPGRNEAQRTIRLEAEAREQGDHRAAAVRVETTDLGLVVAALVVAVADLGQLPDTGRPALRRPAQPDHSREASLRKPL